MYLTTYVCIYTICILCIPKLDQVIWERNVYDTIIPDECELYTKTGRVEVKLKKKNPGKWKRLRDPTVCILVRVCM